MPKKATHAVYHFLHSPRVKLFHFHMQDGDDEYKQDHFLGVLPQKCSIRYICISQRVFHTFRTGFITTCSKCEDLVCTNIVQYHWYTFRQNRCGKVSSPTGGKKKEAFKVFTSHIFQDVGSLRSEHFELLKILKIQNNSNNHLINFR